MNQVYLSIGSNINREVNIRSAISELRKYGHLEISPVYQCEAVGFDGPAFYNLAVGFQTLLDLQVLAAELRDIEYNHGRKRTGIKFSSRTLDIDILIYADLIGDFDRIILPRDEITKNAFVLRPLADIAGNKLHPTRKLSYAELWDAYDDSQQPLTAVPFDYDTKPH